MQPSQPAELKEKEREREEESKRRQEKGKRSIQKYRCSDAPAAFSSLAIENDEAREKKKRRRKGKKRGGKDAFENVNVTRGEKEEFERRTSEPIKKEQRRTWGGPTEAVFIRTERHRRIFSLATDTLGNRFAGTGGKKKDATGRERSKRTRLRAANDTVRHFSIFFPFSLLLSMGNSRDNVETIRLLGECRVAIPRVSFRSHDPRASQIDPWVISRVFRSCENM